MIYAKVTFTEDTIICVCGGCLFIYEGLQVTIRGEGFVKVLCLEID